MPSRSCVDFLDPVDLPSPGRSPARAISDLCESPLPRQRRIIVTNQLPLLSRRDPSTREWSFDWDQDALSLQLRAGFPSGTEVFHVGTLPAEIDSDSDFDSGEKEAISQLLLEQFRCVPVFLPSEIHKRYYHGFCKHYLWPLFHYMLPFLPIDRGGLQFDRSLWQAYVSANKLFADKVTESLNPYEDYVWIHDYHLMALPTFLRRRSHQVRIGFFLHSPFPSSEIYRTLPVRDEILRALLNCDLIGFHTFDYARHFLSCCSRMLGIDYESKRGYIGLEYYGRTVSIKILPVGVDMDLLERVIRSPETNAKIAELSEKYRNRTLVLGVDDMDSFKGISLKFMAMGQLLEENREWRGNAVLVQIANPARSNGKDVQEVNNEMREIAKRINGKFGFPGYDPIVIIDSGVPTFEKVAYYAIAEICVVNALRDGMNLVPYKYTVCRQRNPLTEKLSKKSVIVVSEFIGCSPSLSGAIRVNPWNVDSVTEAIHSGIKMQEEEKRMRHEKHFKYISFHDVAYWARSFDQDLHRACKEHAIKTCWGIGFGLGFRVVALGPSFRKLSIERLVSKYRSAGSRMILLDYDGTIMPHASLNKAPSEEIISVLRSLCEDSKNVVFVVSGRHKDCLSEWFKPIEKLGISAEHGFFTRWSADSAWEKCSLSVESSWKGIVEPVMNLYTETTDGSTIERKESALVWHHQYADPDFGACQAKELLDHLENVLANEPVVVTRGHHIVEAKPQGVSKGVAVDELMKRVRRMTGNSPEFVLCVGDDRSDEDMFETITRSLTSSSSSYSSGLFACTVGQKPSKARYYLDDPAEVMRMLHGLADPDSALQSPAVVAFEQ